MDRAQPTVLFAIARQPYRRWSGWYTSSASRKKITCRPEARPGGGRHEGLKNGAGTAGPKTAQMKAQPETPDVIDGTWQHTEATAERGGAVAAVGNNS